MPRPKALSNMQKTGRQTRSKATQLDRARKSGTPALVEESVLTIRGVKNLSTRQRAELLRLVRRILKETRRNENPLIRTRKTTDMVVYYLSKKRQTTRIARQVASAFKHFTPSVEDHSPGSHEHENVIVRLHAAR